MKILVTGASGFIGSNVMQYLRHCGYTVVGCSRAKIESENYIKCDLSKELPRIETDIVVHAAAVSPSENYSFADYFNNNVIATKNVLEYSEKKHIRRIIYMAAVSSYGDVNNILKEDSPHNNPDDYGLTKYVGEQLIKNSKIPYYILILPGVIGKGGRDNWIMRAARTLQSGQKFSYYNGQGIFNNILEIEDLCKFILLLIQKDSEDSDTFLLGSSEIMTIDDVVNFLKEKLLSNSELYCDPHNKGSFYLDIKKALSVGFYSKPIVEILEEVCREILGEKTEINH